MSAQEEPDHPRNQSILHQIEERIGARARVALHDIESGRPVSGTVPGESDEEREDFAGRYQIRRLLGQGGMGSVHEGRDADLGRDVAMKFLHEQFRDRPDVLQRFVEEAQIGGQLQHPGIVPVYELGISEGQPFFAMKMVKGQTLASRLEARSSPADDLGTYLAIFEDICQTMAYAHARGVVHRDLKPENVMIGSFGEVQVVDWGMGKVLPRDGEAVVELQRPTEEEHDQIETVRSEGKGMPSVTGSVIGTPAYMPREQALGDVDAMDRRSDVFALGAILCEILTGRPPYEGTLHEALVKAAQAELDGAHERLRQCGGEPGLVDLAIRCLQADPEARPESASAVAEVVHAHIAATEARAQEATLRAMTLRRTQKYGIALTVVIAFGLAVSLWFWRDAVGQRERAEGAATEADEARSQEATARRRAETNLANFNRLSNVVRLEKARDEARALYPAWPETAEALRVWLDRDARALRDALPELRATVAVLKERALPRTEEEAEAERRAHPRAAELATMAGRLGMLERAKAVRSGAAKPPVFELRDTDLPSTARELNGLAWPLVDPGRKTYGREAEGLALARRAVARAVADGIPSSPMRDSLAWALFAVGLDEEAVAQSEAALAAAPENQRALFEKALVNLRNAVAWVSGPEGRANIAGLAAQVRKLREEVNARKIWRFADEADAFLHATLGEVIAGIEAFEREEAADVGRRLKWAERVEELTITRHAKQWEVARKAIRKADGKTASRLYAAVPLDLEPQIGLVPIGMNRRTGLWEFYHLRSAWDPDRHPDPADIEIAGFAADGRIDMEGRGVVFVLLPGGRFTMGAQRGDPAAPHYDPAAEDEEAPVTEVELAPFFLSRYEMTQGQWSRLTGGGAPSWYIVGNGYHGIPVPIADHHPVEQVDWGMCAELMRQQGLALPTEAQWEYGCRAGTSTPWSTGRVVESLHGFANVLDRTGQSVEPVWPGGEAFDDGFKGPAPVGNYAANAFGLHDMHGNVWEWCRDWFGLYSTPTRGGDGLREPAQHEDIRASRGGSYQQAAFMARSAFRAYRAPNARSPVVGFRAARRIDSRSR